jgi:hypothetical protein
MCGKLSANHSFREGRPHGTFASLGRHVPQRHAVIICRTGEKDITIPMNDKFMGSFGETQDRGHRTDIQAGYPHNS